MTLSLRLLSWTLVYFVLFTKFTLAALQNVTVDDAVLVGAVVPQYLPTPSDWNIGNTCTGCFVQPDPSLAYNGTWHDTTYSSTNDYTQTIELSFTGSAVYIFFIIANTVPYASTLTAVDFVLDNVNVHSYTHVPDNTTNYLYNVPVYANDTLASGQHTLMIQPVNTGNNVLILFDYFVYATDQSTPVSSSSVSSSSSPSSSPSNTQASSGPNIGVIIGGTVGGVATLVVVTGCLLCYRRHKNHEPLAGEEATADLFETTHEVASASLIGSSLITPMGPHTEPSSRSKSATAPSNLPPSIPTSSHAPSSLVGASDSGNVNLLEQVGLLRNEVARLRHMHSSSNNIVIVHSEEPPEYTD